MKKRKADMFQTIRISIVLICMGLAMGCTTITPAPESKSSSTESTKADTIEAAVAGAPCAAGYSNGECKAADPCRSTVLKNGQCHSADEFMQKAHATCEQLGMSLSAWSFAKPCKGGYGAMKITCCPGQQEEVCCKTSAGPQMVPADKCDTTMALPLEQCQEPCRVGKINSLQCHSLAEWLAIGEKKCAGIGMELTDYSTGGPCADGGFHSFKMECCPGEPELVCCETATGLEILPEDKCPTAQQLPMDVCEEPEPIEVCCMLPSGVVTTTTNIKCEKSGGQIVPDEKCDFTEPVDVCCLLDGQLMTITDEKCEANGGQIVPDEKCDPVVIIDVCCVLPDGTVLNTTNIKCESAGGQIVADEKCDPEPVEVCCWINGQLITILDIECKASGGQIVHDEKCDQEPVDVCCLLDGQVFTTTDEKCKANGGQIVADEKCDDPTPVEVCCLTSDGTLTTTTDIKCKESGGQIVADEKCDDDTPCFPANLGQNSFQCQSEAAWLASAAKKCGDGFVVSQYTLGPQCADGGYHGIKFECCPGGPKPCDAGISGFCDGFSTSSYVNQCLAAGGTCAPNAIFADGNCDGKLDVCKICPAGTAPADLDGDGCEESCDCCPAIKCPLGTTPTDTDGNGCYDTCKKNLCDAGFYGWCEDQNPQSYLKQCLAAGGGCGPNAILADQNCDGKLDVCKLCPAGTHAVDTNNDGCQDACDCCKPLLCIVGTTPTDTDNDGCPDTCKGEPCAQILCIKGTTPTDTDGDGCDDICKPNLCDQGISGWCEDVKEQSYLKQCLAWGGTCGNNAIFADKDCDGSLDVCQLCPPGTHPVDLDNDGCQEACDCCKELVCPVGYIAIDTDKDGCDDKCKPAPCDKAVFGQCKGFNYTKQCLAMGGGCGPNGILSDQNCDGNLDVCLECPAGTHAVDLSGDGCQDTCDCCKPLICPVGSKQVDTDKDGCPDTCKGFAADEKK